MVQFELKQKISLSICSFLRKATEKEEKEITKKEGKENNNKTIKYWKKAVLSSSNNSLQSPVKCTTVNNNLKEKWIKNKVIKIKIKIKKC